MTTTDVLDTLTTLAVAGALTAPVVYLLERTHRRAALDGGRVAHWLRAVDEDADARRLADELRALAEPEPRPDRGPAATPTTSATSAAPAAARHPARHHAPRVTPAR